MDIMGILVLFLMAPLRQTFRVLGLTLISVIFAMLEFGDMFSSRELPPVRLLVIFYMEFYFPCY